MRRYYIVEGDKTTVGGVVQKHTGAGSTTTWHGKTVNNIDDKIDCPACHSIGIIQPVGDRHPFGNRGFIPALNDDICICKCSPPPKLIHSQMVFYQDVSEVENQDWLVSNARPSHDDNASHDNSPLRKFHVHFRRPSNYKGEFGFDWLRDEYLYDTNGQNRIYQGTDKFLIEEYRTFKKQPVVQLEKIETYDNLYIPAWLNVFVGQSVKLQIQIDQVQNEIDTFLADDGTNLVFECSQDISIILPTGDNKLSLGNFLNPNDTKIVQLKENNNTKSFNRYLSSFFITVTVSKAISSLGWVKIFAKKGNEQKQVGLLCVYPNNVVKTARIKTVFISVRRNSPHVFHYEKYQNIIATQFLNQALIKFEDVNPNPKNEIFYNIYDLLADNTTPRYKKDKISVFLRKFYVKDSQKDNNKNILQISNDELLRLLDKDNINIDGNHADKFLKEIIDLYYYLTDCQDNPRNNSTTTYLFVTDYTANNVIGEGGTGGIALAEEASDQAIAMCQIDRICNHWKNVALVFGSVGDEDSAYTMCHELGHSFGLSHPFVDNPEKIESNFLFSKGKTDNIMDYMLIDNQIKNSEIAIWKWQWDIMQNDENLINK